jgi:hypothetical protein
VCRARDNRLGGEIAIKVPAEFAADPERLLRFEQEAHAIAALNHPTILAIHDFEREGKRVFAVAELLGGLLAAAEDERPSSRRLQIRGWMIFPKLPLDGNSWAQPLFSAGTFRESNPAASGSPWEIERGTGP